MGNKDKKLQIFVLCEDQDRMADLCEKLRADIPDAEIEAADDPADLSVRLKTQPGEEERHDLFIKAFGNFELRIDGKPVRVKRTKTKELLAYLVDRNGSMVGDYELMHALWNKDDSTAKSYLRILKAELMKIFADAGYADALVKQRGCMGIRNDIVRCDFFDAVRTAPPDLSAYHGEYMRQYAWSGSTRSMLDEQLSNKVL